MTLVGGLELEGVSQSLPLFTLLEDGRLFTVDPVSKSTVVFETSPDIRLDIDDGLGVPGVSTVLVRGSNYMSS
jgi:hypothetical protein